MEDQVNKYNKEVIRIIALKDQIGTKHMTMKRDYIKQKESYDLKVKELYMLIGSLFSPMRQESIEEQFKIQDFQGVVHSLKQMTFSGSPEDLSYLDNVFKFASFTKMVTFQHS